jgi:hypothetical protein
LLDKAEQQATEGIDALPSALEKVSASAEQAAVTATKITTK